MQLLLLPWAILGLAFYVIGYPVLVVLVLWRYRYQMMEDQLLRAMGTGKTRLTNPHGACLIMCLQVITCSAGRCARLAEWRQSLCRGRVPPLPVTLAAYSTRKRFQKLY